MCVKSFRDKSSADSLNLVRCNFTLCESLRCLRLNSNNLYIFILRLQILSNACHRTTSSYSSYKVINLSISVFPDLRTSSIPVSCRVRWIYKLSWDIAVLCLSCNLLSLSDSSLHALCSFGQNKLRAVCLHKLSSLYRHSLRHNYYSFIALSCSYSSEPNTGITRSWFYDGCTWL